MSGKYKTNFDAVNNIWSGKFKVPLYNNEISLGEVALELLNRNPNKVGQISDDTGIQITNGEMRLSIIRVAQHLVEKNIKKRDVIFIISKNNHHLASVLFAGALIGAPIQANNPNLIINDIVHNMSLTKPKIIFCETEKLSDIREALKVIDHVAPIVTFDKRLEDAMFIDDFLKETGTEHDYIPEPIGNGKEEIVTILSSSGTTGLSKGVCLSHALLLHQMTNFLDVHEYDVSFTFTTLEWLSCVSFIVCGILNGVTRIITREKFSPELFIEIIEKYKVTCCFLPPLLTNQLVESTKFNKADFSTIRIFLCGGSTVPVSVKQKMEKLMENRKMVVGYGGTEAGGSVAMDLLGNKPGSVGLLQTGINVKLVDDDNKSLGIGEKGEILVKGYHKFLGYYNDEKATKETITEDGWVRTSDVGYFDEDGYLYICDRKKDVFKYNTYHISPTEIEDIILECPGVTAACVVGIPIEVNELIGALIVKSIGSQVTEKEIYDFVASRVIDYKNLRGGIYFVNELPTTLTGKLLRRKVLEIAIEFYNKAK